MHIRCMSAQLHTVISNDLTCDTIVSRNILAELDVKYLSKQTSDAEYRENPVAEFKIWQYRRKDCPTTTGRRTHHVTNNTQHNHFGSRAEMLLMFR